MGDGRYSEKLDYKSWMAYNCAQRVHLNYCEQLPITVLVLAIAGLVLPKGAMYLGFTVLLGRIIYTISYLKGGPEARYIGVAVGSLPIYCLLLGSIIELIRLSAATPLTQSL